MAYASGEEPIVGDVVKCGDVTGPDGEVRRTQEVYTVVSISSPYIEIEHGCFKMPWRFKLIRRATPEQPAAKESTLNELVELRKKAEKVKGECIEFGIDQYGGWLGVGIYKLRITTTESLRDILTELATPKPVIESYERYTSKGWELCISGTHLSVSSVDVWRLAVEFLGDKLKEDTERAKNMAKQFE